MATSTWKCESQQHEYFFFIFCSSKHHVALNARVGPGVEGGGGFTV